MFQTIVFPIPDVVSHLSGPWLLGLCLDFQGKILQPDCFALLGPGGFFCGKWEACLPFGRVGLFLPLDEILADSSALGHKFQLFAAF